jgi:hypothetical protein
MTAASYRLLVPHFVQNAWLDANTIVTEGQQIPVGWPPSLGCDPLNAAGVTAFAAQPPGQTPLVQSQFSNNVVGPPLTYWLRSFTPADSDGNGGDTSWRLTGLGAGLSPVFN